MDELDERALLFISQVSPHGELLGVITGCEIYHLCILNRLKLCFFLYVWFFQCCSIIRFYLRLVNFQFFLNTGLLC